ncbi:MAG: large subunit ribosomal protein L10 [Parcubacteria group bacterium Athens1014_10]|nr:MAG: large subunit ribosomal protein L10 [Parcubacteria group bacterium Athens1014_10]TSD05991.1 MAG: large subunit ribosomal protein L10 [Parcubacteria group bacterium Athens0714_12]
MAKTKEQKKQMVENLKEKFGKMKIAVFADYFGLKVKEIQELKNLLKKQQSDYIISKKTLTELSLKNAGIEDIKLGEMEGGLGILFGYEDEITPVKVLTKFSKEHKALKIKGGILERKFINLEKVLELSKLPSKPELISKLLWQIKSPVSRLVNVLQGNLRGLTCLLNNLSKK